MFHASVALGTLGVRGAPGPNPSVRENLCDDEMDGFGGRAGRRRLDGMPAKAPRRPSAARRWSGRPTECRSQVSGAGPHARRRPNTSAFLAKEAQEGPWLARRAILRRRAAFNRAGGRSALLGPSQGLEGAFRGDRQQCGFTGENEHHPGVPGSASPRAGGPGGSGRRREGHPQGAGQAPGTELSATGPGRPFRPPRGPASPTAARAPRRPRRCCRSSRARG